MTLPDNLMIAIDNNNQLTDNEKVIDTVLTLYHTQLVNCQDLLDWNDYGAITAFIKNIAIKFIGYDHASDFLDDATDAEYSAIAGISQQAVIIDEDDSSYYEDYSLSYELDRWDNYDLVKDAFKDAFTVKAKNSGLTSISGFENFFKVFVKYGYNDVSPNFLSTFENILFKSQLFETICTKITTDYTG